MSLLDTINGAREEIAQSGNPFSRNDDEGKKAVETNAEGDNASTTGFSKRSTARAKPRREAASSVRYVSDEEYQKEKDAEEAKNLTRAERHARADRARSAEDRRATVERYILNGHAEYKRAQRVWLGLIIGGIVVTLLTWVIGTLLPDEMGQAKAVMAGVLLVAAYGCVIGAFVYDWRVVRPMRNAAQEEAARMSDKRVKQYLNDRIAAEHAAAERGETKPSLFSRITGR
jgi:hypothetical protein